MTKKFLSILAVGLMLVMAGFASAAPIAGVNFLTPVGGSAISGSYSVTWTNTNGYPIMGLQYREGGCGDDNWKSILSGPFNEDVLTYTWNTLLRTDGTYCLKLFQDVTYSTLSGEFKIDNTNPVADAGGPYTCNEGATINLDASGSSDAMSGIASYAWDYDNDGAYDDANGVNLAFSCLDGPSTASVSVKVTDNAGNENTDSANVNVVNVAPTNCAITASSEATVGQVVTFTGSATDVAADSLNYNWVFGDSGTGIGSPTTHTYTNAGAYIITLSVSDGDGGSCTATKPINIFPVIALTNQEVIAFHALDANFGANAGAVDNSFATGLIGVTSCTNLIGSPVNLQVTNSGNDCVIKWGDETNLATARPKNNEQGNHQIVIKATNGVNTNYYSFNIVVYSWIINLRENWNLFSIPLVPESTAIGNVLGADVLQNAEYIWSYEYDAVSGSSEWKCSQPNAGKTAWTLCTGVPHQVSAIEPGKGYWIKMNSETYVKGVGQKTTQSSTMPGMIPEVKIPFNAWALIGRYGITGYEDQVARTGASSNAAGSLGRWHALTSLSAQGVDISKASIYEYDGLSVIHTAYLDSQKGYWAFVGNTALTNGVYTPTNLHYSYN